MFRNCWVVMLTAALPATSAFSHLKTLISANETLTDQSWHYARAIERL